MSSSVKNSGAACGPSTAPMCQGDANSGRSEGGTGVPDAVTVPPCSTSPVRSARPPWPPNLPSVKVAALPRNGRHVQAAAREQYVRPQALFRRGADRQHGARGNRHRLPLRDRRAVHGDRRRGPGHAHRGGVREPQRRSLEGAFEAGGALVVAEGAVAEPERAGRPSGRTAARPPASSRCGPASPGPWSASRRRRPRCAASDRSPRRGSPWSAWRPGSPGSPAPPAPGPGSSRCRRPGCGPAPRRAVRSACSRSAPYAITFASIGSYAVVTSVPVSTQPSIRTPARELDPGQQAGAGPVFARGVLGVDAGLDGVTAGRARVSYDVGVTAGQAQHPGDEVDAVDLLGDRMLHLEPGVDLQEVRLLAGGVVHELDRAGGAVADARRTSRGRRRPVAPGRVRAGRAPGPPPPPSGCGAGASSRGRRR